MKQYSSNDRPAVESLTDDLLQCFGDKLEGKDADWPKMCFGMLTRQIMEWHGFKKIKGGVHCRDKRVFSKGSIYSRSVPR